jgi:hypothetical protein
MISSVFAEDLFQVFYELAEARTLPIQHQDYSPMHSFYIKIIKGEQLTQNQANYVLKLLEKYKTISAVNGFDYAVHLPTLSWKTPFRILDLSKKIYIEKNKDGKLEICVKFPYQLKKAFEDEIDSARSDSSKSSYWDNDQKVRRLSFYDYNLMSLYEFATAHRFEIDETFLLALADVEEIWQNSDDVQPYSEISDLGVILKNANQDTAQWWIDQPTKSFTDDLLLAKSMGFPLKKIPTTTLERIAVSAENSFWMKSNKELFSLYKQIDGKLCVILDRTSNTLDWLKAFVSDADESGINRDEIKVCFRENKDSKTGLNDWIKLAGVGGKVESGKILIFEFKPAKWLFKEQQDVKILVTNNLYPSTNQITKDWFNSHPCVIYLGDIKPSEQRGQKIVEL